LLLGSGAAAPALLVKGYVNANLRAVNKNARMKLTGLLERFSVGVRMNNYQSIEVRVGRTQADVLDNQCCMIVQCDTIKEAKARAKQYIKDGNGYAQVVAEDRCVCCVYDYFQR